MRNLCVLKTSSNIAFLELGRSASVYQPGIFWSLLMSVLLVFCSLDA